ncbi:MAG: hypothetical protein OEZ22_02975 [Spirochaetia bacterium]|nr:hypothetical protein [Spirochaetia bacterium]
MDINFPQLWDNIVLFVIIAFFIEMALSSLLSIGYVQNLLRSSEANVKNIIVLIVAFGLCMKIPKLRILLGTKGIPSTIHLVISALVLSKIVDFFSNMKNK